MSSSTDPNLRTQQDIGYVIANGISTNATNLNIQNNTNINTTSNLVTNNLLNNNVNAEQPQTKRQKIEKIKPSNGSTKTKSSSGSTTLSPPPDIIETGESKNLCSSPSSSAHSTTSPSSSDNSSSSTPCSSRAASLTQLLNVQNLNHNLPLTNGLNHNYHLHNEDDLMTSSETKTCNSSSSNSADEVDRSSLPYLLPLNSQSPIITPSTTTSNKVRHSLHINSSSPFHQPPHLDELTASQDMRDFEDSLNKQCLCGVSEQMLRKPFQSHYSLDAKGQKRVAKLSEWPTNKLLQFLSNLQLLFDIYLKQNSKGFICARIMDVCDALIRNDHNLIDEIIVLAGYSNPYVQFLAGRVLASFLVIAKQEMDDNWLKKLVDNLFKFDRLDHKAVQKIHFSLEIIKRIVEWKDIDLHPLEEEIADTQHIPDGMPSTSSSSFHNTNTSVSVADEMNLGYIHFQAQQPSLESNYFAVHYRSTESLDEPSPSGSSFGHYNHNALSSHHFNNMSSPSYHQHHNTPHHTPQHQPAILQQQDCHLITLTDSESFDTTHLKCKTIKILENKWPALVDNMTSLIKHHLEVENAENCILNFLQLWEKIISVKANLPIGETHPFYAQLDIKLLLNHDLSCTVYKQMLCLFNEALCYGSTLALQDMLPNETCKLAQQIVIHVKDSPISESLPRRQPENVVGLIGFKRKPINYGLNSLQHQFGVIDEGTENALNPSDVIKMDKTILQNFVLLVLKSIAVEVKVISNDSSDSSLDSTDYDAFQDMELIESIRIVLRKLESFIKHTFELLPQSHFSEVLIRLFDDQDDHLIEAMVCTLDVAARISFRDNALPELVSMLNPVYTFLEFLKSIRYRYDLLLYLLVSNETCFLLYLLRFLKCICKNWNWFVTSCDYFGSSTFGSSTVVVAAGMQQQQQQSTLDEAMSVLISLRLQISHLVSRQLYPYDISPVTHLLEGCERFYEGEPL